MHNERVLRCCSHLRTCAKEEEAKMRFEEPEIIELGLAAELTQIDYGMAMEDPPNPTPCYDPLAICLPE